MVMFVEPGKTWCLAIVVIELSFCSFPDMVFDSVEDARDVAEALKAEKSGGVSPVGTFNG